MGAESMALDDDDDDDDYTVMYYKLLYFNAIFLCK